MKRVLSIFIIFAFLFFNCDFVLAKTAVQPMSMFEIREVQTRLLDSSDTKQVAKAVINTLQDNGFIIQNIEPDLGYIRAKKEVKLKRTMKSRVILYSFMELCYGACLGLSLGTDPSSYYGLYQTSMQLKNEIAPHTVIFDSNVSIQNLGKKTKVRFSVIEKILENGDGYTTVKSSPRKVVRHYEPEIYQEFFNQVDKNLFFEKNL